MCEHDSFVYPETHTETSRFYIANAYWLRDIGCCYILYIVVNGALCMFSST